MYVKDKEVWDIVNMKTHLKHAKKDGSKTVTDEIKKGFRITSDRFGALLKEGRLKKKLEHSKLASILNMKENLIHKIELGETKTDDKTIQRLSDVLDLNKAEMLIASRVIETVKIAPEIKDSKTMSDSEAIQMIFKEARKQNVSVGFLIKKKFGV